MENPFQKRCHKPTKKAILKRIVATAPTSCFPTKNTFVDYSQAILKLEPIGFVPHGNQLPNKNI